MNKYAADGFYKTRPQAIDDPNGRKILRYVTPEGTPCPTVFLEDKDAQAAARYRSVIKDLEFSEACLLLAIESFPPIEVAYQASEAEGNMHVSLADANALVIRSLYISAVITYSKAFSEAKGRGLKLDGSNVFRAKAELRIHKEILKERDTYVAHAGVNKREAAAVVVALDPGEDQRILDGPFVHSSFMNFPPVEEFHDFLAVVRGAKAHCTNLEQQKLKLIHERVMSTPIQDLYASASAGGSRLIPRVTK